MDLVSIGYEINARGLEKANKEVDALHNKIDKLGKAKSVNADVTNATKQQLTSVNATTKALEKQMLIGEYLGKGFDKSTASTIASFKQMGATVEQTNNQLQQLTQNKGLVQTQKELTLLNKEQEKAKKLVEQTQQEYQKLSAKSLGGGVLDTVERQNKSLSEMKKHYQSLEASQEKQQQSVQKVVGSYEKLSSKSLGGGILDTIDKQDKGLQNLSKYYSDIEASQSKQVEESQKALALQEKQISLAKQSAKYRQEGFTSTNATKLSTFEIGGASTQQVEQYKNALMSAQGGLKQFGGASEETARKVGFLNTEVGGIAKYAVLSAVIYGLMTATTNLAIATVKMADEYTAIQNRMKLYIKDANELMDVNRKLAQYSIENNVGLRETSTLFTRLAPSMQRMGKTTEDINKVVDAFGKSMRIGGATAMEAASATIQFSQAMASGKLAGDEFRSISEASPRFLKAIAEGSGIAAEKLKEMSSAGMLTTEVISKALIKEYGNLSSENAKLGTTLEQGANAIKTMFTVMVGEFNEGAGVTQFLGETMVGLANSMQEASNSAKESGASFKKWIEDNQAVIEALKFGVIALSSAITAKLIIALTASIATTVTATATNLRYQATLLSMATSSGVASVGVGKLALSFRALGVAMSSVPFLGWASLALTLGGIGATYLSMSNSAKEATRASAEHGEEITKTVDELKKLQGVQKDIESTKLSDAFKEQTKALEEYDQQIKNVVNAERARSGLSEETTKLLHGLKDGTISYSQALEELNKMKGVSPESIKLMEDLIKKYDTASISAQKNAEQQKVLGNNVSVAGNQMQNAKVYADSLSSATDKVASSAENAGNKLRRMGDDIRKSIEKNAQIISLVGKTGLGQSSVTEIVNTVDKQLELATANYESATESYKKVQEIHKKTMSEGKPDARVEKALTQAKQSVEYAGKFLQQRKDIAQQSLVPLLKEREVQESILSNMSKKGKEEDKAENRQQKIVDGYEDQISSVQQLLSLTRSGVNYEVAKVASQKDYIKVYGSNLDMAKRIVAVEAQRLAIEKEIEASKSRSEAHKSLRSQIASYTTIGKLMEQGYSYSVAQRAVQAGFKDNAEGISHANGLVTLSLQDQLTSVVDQTRYQEDLLDFVKSGLSIEEARAKVEIYRNKNLEKGMVVHSEALSLAERDKVVAEARVRAQVELNALSSQSNNLIVTQNNALADLATQYRGIGLEEAKSLHARTQIVEKLREYNDQLKAQASLTSSIEKVDFEVFGDFGDPFKSALDSLNRMVFGVQEVKKEYQAMYDELGKEILANAGNVKMQQASEQKLANLKIKQVQEEEDAKRKAIGSAISLTKSMFNEESRGYKVIGALEKAYQASQVAFALWEKKEAITAFATKSALKAKEIILEQGVNIVKGIGAVLTQGTGGDVWSAIPRMAAMAAVVAGLGVAIGSVSGGSSGSFDSHNNEGKGTVFGDSDATSKSISNAIDRLSDNSDLMLPVNQAMLKSLRNIENSFKGVANLLIRGEVGQGVASDFGFDAVLTGTVGKIHDFTSKMTKMFTGFTDKLTGLPLGDALNDLVGGLIGGLFGKTSQTVVAQGLVGFEQTLGNILSKGFDLSEYADVETKKKSWFSSKTSRSTQYADASQEIESQFSLIFGNIFDSVMSATSVLDMDGVEIRKKLESFVVNLGKIDTKGLSGGEIQEKLESVIGAEADKIAKYATNALLSFQQVGEGYFETLTRVASGIEVAKYYTERLNVATVDYQDIINKQGDVTTELIRQSVLLNESTKNINGGFYDLVNTFDGSTDELVEFVYTLRDLQDQLFVAGKNVEYLTSSMILGAGGIESLASGFNAYFDLLSPAEQASELTRRLANEMSLLGQELPKDVQGFRDLLASIDVTTESGQKLYGGLIALTPEFVDLQSALEASASEAERMAQEALKAQEEARKAQEEARKAQEEFEAMMKKLRQAIIITGQTADKVNQSMINGAGSSDILLKGFESIFGMLSPAEKATELTRRMTEQFKALGVEMPKSIDDYRALLKGMDLSSDASKHLFGQIVALAPEFAELHSAMESANTGVDALVQSLRDLAEEAMKARGETNQTSNLEATRHAFSVNSALAMQGDRDATERLLSLGANLLELSKTYSITSDDYTRDLALVQSSATKSADIQELGLGYENEPLIPVSSIGQTNTLETKSGETDEKIETMRLDLNSALIAIAKYTQITATKLENWDYEGRMLVRVEQDPVNDAIPVKAL